MNQPALIFWHTTCPYFLTQNLPLCPYWATMITQSLSSLHEPTCPYFLTHNLPWPKTFHSVLIVWHKICLYCLKHNLSLPNTQLVLIVWHTTCPYCLTHSLSILFDTQPALIIWHTKCPFMVLYTSSSCCHNLPLKQCCKGSSGHVSLWDNWPTMSHNGDSHRSLF